MESKSIPASAIKSLAEEAMRGLEIRAEKMRKQRVDGLCWCDPSPIARFMCYLWGCKTYTREQAEKMVSPDYGLMWLGKEIKKTKAIIALCDMSMGDTYLTVNPDVMRIIREGGIK